MPISRQKTAYSYIRFSSKEQAHGGSEGRQTRLSEAWCEKRGVRLDDTLSLRDLGVSAFRGDNVKEGALAGFLEACRTGRVLRGSYLIVESLDRLSRDQIRPALQLFLALQDFGITIVTMQPEREYPPDDMDALALIEPLIVFARAHEESDMKSHRRRDGWDQAKARARAGGGPMQKTCPSWLAVTPKGFEVKEEAAAVVRRIFGMARDGMGLSSITGRLARENVPPIGNCGRWSRAYVYRLLTSPAAMGSYQPQRNVGKRKILDGAPIPGHYPAVVTEGEWQAAQDAIAGRSGGAWAGRRGGDEANLFTGIAHLATRGARMVLAHSLSRKTGPDQRVEDRRRYLYLAPIGGTGAPQGCRIDYGVFEAAVLSALKELRPSDIAAGPQGAPDRGGELARLSGRLLDIDGRLERAQKRARTAADFDAFLDLIEALQAERKQVAERRAELEREEGGRESSDLGEAHSLIAMLEQAPPEQREDLRRRLKGRIRQLVTGLWVVVHRRGKTCVCAVQLWFRGGDRRRDYLIVHTPRARTAGKQWSVRSLASESTPGGLDLRDPKHAARLAAALEKIDLES